MASIQQSPLLSLLLVEDDKTACDLVARMVTLNFPHSKIYIAENGMQGVELFRKHAPDIVITDISMPEMDGIEMAREIKVINPLATYIVLTARNDNDTYEKFKKIGFCAFLPKPLNYRDLFKAIEKCSPHKPLG